MKRSLRFSHIGNAGDIRHAIDQSPHYGHLSHPRPAFRAKGNLFTHNGAINLI